ncbi:GCN5 family acetyltransferase [Peribacillus butanolivorans]|uniref:GNAT family N-acetyltransferase n=1 Tax=Peribacillus butanolivorans TaxID=421767 RepID=UPI0006A6BB1A|nr:GNAT family N-acetyltransferase [Peribacillus butanolivorans]KON70670.1 GCN5 family acetyltransferase [Peribacillus butanolivorans]
MSGVSEISERNKENGLQIKPWEDRNLDLLFHLNAPEMMEHLGGPESKEQILKRHKRYLEIGSKGCMFSITLYPEEEAVGSVGYWRTVWNDETVYEIGWSVLPSYQGKRIASRAVKAVIAKVKAERKYKYIHAFPSINNPASNAICRKLDFNLISECEFEYPPGSFMRCNNWRLELQHQARTE